MIALPDGERLLLTVDRVVGIVCDDCCKGVAEQRGSDVLPCHICHGTGTVQKRLRGWVEVEPLVLNIYGTDEMIVGFESPAGGWEGLKVYRDDITAAFLDGTLPEGLLYHETERPWGLRLEDVE